MKGATKLNRSLPAVFEADTMDYDEEKKIVIATGNVYISHGMKILRADRVEYDQLQDKVTASGNVWIKDDDGNYSFMQYVELTNNMEDGLVDHILFVSSTYCINE